MQHAVFWKMEGTLSTKMESKPVGRRGYSISYYSEGMPCHFQGVLVQQSLTVKALEGSFHHLAMTWEKLGREEVVVASDYDRKLNRVQYRQDAQLPMSE